MVRPQLRTVRIMVDPLSPEQMYRQVARILADRIAHGEYRPGRPLPSEGHLQQEFGVARQTVRRAMALLREQGLIVTVMGKGSYVAGESLSD